MKAGHSVAADYGFGWKSGCSRIAISLTPRITCEILPAKIISPLVI
jgi:hypothetical protein